MRTTFVLSLWSLHGWRIAKARKDRYFSDRLLSPIVNPVCGCDATKRLLSLRALAHRAYAF